MLKRLYSLDTLRGFAALSIVIWHWQHFFAISGTWQPGWQKTSQPFYLFLKPLYDEGWAAVDLFFALSGFIFFWLYGEAIREGRMGAGRFAWLRFSRLYPLHLVTLLAVAAMQYFFERATGNYFIFDVNDAQHFLTSLLFAQQWLPPTLDQSFNGPSWSVSIEVLLYGVFFVFCRSGLRGPWMALLIAVLAIPLLVWNEFIARGLMGFFLGGATYHVSRLFVAHASARRIAQWSAAIALGLWAVVWIEAYLGPLHAACYWLSGHISPELGRLYIGYSRNLFLLLFVFIVAPATLLALALHEQVLGGAWHRLAFVGDISYSTYMLHFPMQLALALIAVRFALTPATFQNPVALILFYVALIGLGGLSFHYFERPMQNFLRGVLPKKSLASEN
jgi:peptidoglycan/LPS O-acetylase OafA/YrhL